MRLLARLKTKAAAKRALLKKQAAMNPARLERRRRAAMGDEMYERLFGNSKTVSAYDGAQQIIARGKANGTYLSDVDPDHKKEAKLARQKFRLNRAHTKRRIATLAKRINGSTSVEVEEAVNHPTERSTTMKAKQKQQRTTHRRDPDTKYKYNEGYLVRSGTMMETMVVIAKRLKTFTRDQLVKAIAVKGALVTEKRAKSFVNWSLAHEVFVPVK